MSSEEIAPIERFLSTFARRQAARTEDFPGGFAVRNGAYTRSHDNNQLIVDAATEPALLAARADALLDGLEHRRITVLPDAVARACAPALAAAGYDHAPELLMVHRGPRPAPAVPAEPVTLDDLREPLTRQLRGWMPQADEETIDHLVSRRAARPGGAPEVLFLAARAEDGAVAAWADLYQDRAAGIAQMEDLVTADEHLRAGHATTVLTTALHRAADARIFFLIAEPDDWPRQWYARSGFAPVGYIHVFTRRA
ncbi:GNAT family N-acetyltransferase [Streptacidiphilus neutrinimicus]|uniref:GNAT family N-acetyltransferase n=1 Tax=Streptacidiphilus neutrinimicus TaxID=105420 RepID=UPI0005AA0559|nr:GNAT family N-acetyltransferase [Streptacidiphilus neutrinimicus]